MPKQTILKESENSLSPNPLPHAQGPRRPGGTGAPCRPGTGPGDPAGNRGAPPRGVDVKPPPGTGVLDPFSGKCPILGILGTFSPVATGPFFEKIAKISDFWPKWAKMPFLAGKPPFWGFLAFLGHFGPAAPGVLHQPPGGPSQGAGSPGDPPDPGSGVPGSRGPGRGSGDLGSRRPGTPPPGAGEVPEGPGTGPGDRGPGPGSSGEGGFTSTPRAGAPRFPGSRPARTGVIPLCGVPLAEPGEGEA